jgi:UDP-2-acetamido-3-amino-2,3-dideoxy-glucuronate N-acetyltransferase
MQQPKTGKGVIIGANVEFGRNVVVWNYVVIGDNTRIGDGTRIGNNVFIAPNSSLLNDKYPKSSLLTSPVVEDNVIIGGGVTVLPDVILGENSVIGGGSVVTKNVPVGKVFMGVPAKEAMTKAEYKSKREAFIRAKQKR